MQIMLLHIYLFSLIENHPFSQRIPSYKPFFRVIQVQGFPRGAGPWHLGRHEEGRVRVPLGPHLGMRQTSEGAELPAHLVQANAHDLGDGEVGPFTSTHGKYTGTMFIRLVQGKIYGKPWVLPSSTGVSCRFPHHTIL